MAKAATNQTYTTTEKMNECGFKRGKQPDRKPRVIVTWRHLAYVPHHRKAEFEALGWKVEDKLNGTHHGDWSCIGEWVGPEGQEPPMPVLRSDDQEHKAVSVGTKC